MTITPARAARRQLLVDRFAEYLTDRGAPADRAQAYAGDLRDIVDALGFALPAALEDVPAPRGDGCSDEARRAAMAQIRAALDPSRTRRPASQPLGEETTPTGISTPAERDRLTSERNPDHRRTEQQA